MSSSSVRRSFTRAAVSSSSSPAFLPPMRAASAFPIGEMASRNAVPPPNSRITATSPMTSSFTAHLGVRQPGALVLPREQPLGKVETLLHLVELVAQFVDFTSQILQLVIA